jgi:hypothetical protein
MICEPFTAVQEGENAAHRKLPVLISGLCFGRRGGDVAVIS